MENDTLCQECEDAPATNEDPRDPPLDEGDEVLCTPCYVSALEELEDYLTQELERVKKKLEQPMG